MQDFLSDLEDLPNHEKMQFIHDFINDNMKYPDNDDIYGNAPITSNAEVIQNWKHGDCDNRAQLSAALLRYAGFDEKNIIFAAEKTSYDNDSPGGHAVTIVRDGDNYYLMDVNLKDAVQIKPDQFDNFEATGQSRDNQKEKLDIKFSPYMLIPIDKGQKAFVDESFIEQLEASSDKELGIKEIAPNL